MQTLAVELIRLEYLEIVRTKSGIVSAQVFNGEGSTVVQLIK